MNKYVSIFIMLNMMFSGIQAMKRPLELDDTLPSLKKPYLATRISQDEPTIPEISYQRPISPLMQLHMSIPQNSPPVTSKVCIPPFEEYSTQKTLTQETIYLQKRANILLEKGISLQKEDHALRMEEFKQKQAELDIKRKSLELKQKNYILKEKIFHWQKAQSEELQKVSLIDMAKLISGYSQRIDNPNTSTQERSELIQIRKNLILLLGSCWNSSIDESK